MNVTDCLPQGVNMHVQNSVRQSGTVADESCVRHIVTRIHRDACRASCSGQEHDMLERH